MVGQLTIPLPRPKELKKFRPISLCNVIFKIVSKCIVNRLWPLLKDLISDKEGAFILGRLTSDNSIISFECIHHIQSLKNGAALLCAYNRGFSKAYGRVNLLF